MDSRVSKTLTISLVVVCVAMLSGCSEQYISNFDCEPFQERIEITRAILVGFRTQIYPVVFTVVGAMGLVRMMRRA